MAAGGGELQATGAHGGTPNIFISYASQDTAVANAVVGALERNGLKCWIAPRDVTPGTFYGDAIVHAIDAAHATVLILSQSAAASPHILREIERASSKRHPVVSLRIDSAPLPAGLEYFLNTSQWLDASDGEPARAFPKLVEAVRTVLTGAIAAGSANSTAPVLPQGSVHRPSRRLLNRPFATVVALIVVTTAGFEGIRLWLSPRRVTTPPSLPVADAALKSGPTISAPISEKSVAVLPFADMSEKKDQEYFADGTAEEILDLLAKVPGLHVPARTSSFYFKGKSEDIPTIARRLMVAHVLEGSVRKSGTHVRITVQLVRADNGYHVWSETYDRKLDDIFTVQDEIAGAVVNALKMTLLAGETPKAAAIASTEAYTLYLQARAIRTNAPQLADSQRAIGCLKRALKLDPNFARAWAELAGDRVSDYLYFGSGNFQQVVAEARYAAGQALKLDPALSDAHLAMGQILSDLEWNWKAAEDEVNQALALDPGNADALEKASDIALTQGHFDKALQLAQRAVARDPLGAWKHGVVGNAQKAGGRLIEAEAAYRQALDIAPAMSQLHLMVGWVLVARDRPAAALAVLEQETDDTYRQVGRAMALDALGRKAEADGALAVAEAKYAREAEFPIAIVYANRNDRDRAFAWLERAYQQHDDWLQWIPGEPLLKKLRGDPRFKAFLRKMNLPE